ncbi:MAG: dTMP kinase [Clostridiales bacterium]|nr:dTMP kinase [Clostridiales bacterium]
MCKMNLRSNKYSGKLIVFEGTDGAGKTTMISMTEKYLKDKLGASNIIEVKQPTDLSRKTKLFQKMMYSETHDDIDYRAVQLLTMSDRIQHCFEIIGPALKAGKTVICDRYVYTSLANMLARGYDNETWFFDVAKHIICPNITFLAYVPPEIAISRIKNRPSESERYLDERLLHNVAGQFLKMAEREGFIVLNTLEQASVAFEQVKEKLIKMGNL